MGGPWISLVLGYLIFRNSPSSPCTAITPVPTTCVQRLLGHLTSHAYWEVAQTIMSISRAQFSQVIAKTPQALMASNVAHFEPQGRRMSCNIHSSVLQYLRRRKALDG